MATTGVTFICGRAGAIDEKGAEVIAEVERQKAEREEAGLKKQKVSPSVLALCRYRGRFFVYLY